MFFRDKISKAGIVSLEHAIMQPDVKLEGLEVVQTKFSYIWHCCLLGVTFQYLTRLNFLLILVPARWTRAWIDWNELQQRTMAANIQITFWNLRWYCKRAVSTKHMICFSPYTWMLLPSWHGSHVKLFFLNIFSFQSILSVVLVQSQAGSFLFSKKNLHPVVEERESEKV